MYFPDHVRSSLFPSLRTQSSDSLSSLDSMFIDDGHIEMKIPHRVESHHDIKCLNKNEFSRIDSHPNMKFGGKNGLRKDCIINMDNKTDSGHFSRIDSHLDMKTMPNIHEDEGESCHSSCLEMKVPSINVTVVPEPDENVALLSGGIDSLPHRIEVV